MLSLLPLRHCTVSSTNTHIVLLYLQKNIGGQRCHHLSSIGRGPELQKNLGLDHLSRSSWVENDVFAKRPLYKEIYGNAIIIFLYFGKFDPVKAIFATKMVTSKKIILAHFSKSSYRIFLIFLIETQFWVLKKGGIEIEIFCVRTMWITPRPHC